MENYIKGVFRQTIFKSDKGYIIGLFKVRETDIESMKDFINKTVTFTGYFHELTENENYYFIGEQVIHPKYGYQFNVKEYERVKPEDKDGIIEFLSSGLFKGVGEKQAKAIVETLGDTALDKILKDKSCLMLVPKLTQKKADIIYNTLIKYEESHKMIVYLTELGFSMKDSLLIYNTYKTNTMRVLEHNIYRIVDDIPEISFSKIDDIGVKNTDDIYNQIRVEACIIHTMKELCFRNGDTYLTYEEIYIGVCNYLKNELDTNIFLESISNLQAELKIQIENEKYYLMEMFEAEENIIHKIKRLIDKDITKYKNLDKEIELLEKDFSIKYNDTQITAIKKALENNILIITGGPGTGKTTIIKAIVELYKRLNNLKMDDLVSRLALLAPTGRASKRMSESTSLPASTIHRFLKWNKETNEFMVNEYDPDFSNLIIVDEVSMIDTRLLDSLLRGLTDNIKLILVGDYNQLPSVGEGDVLKDLINSDMIDTIHLNLLYRQEENSYIPVLAQEIRNDDLSESFTIDKDDYKFLTCDSEFVSNNLVSICNQVIKKGYDYKRVQVMAPMYGGVNGIDNLNKILQEVFNPFDLDKQEIKYGDIIYRENDKVLQLVNKPDDNVYNGDIGIIKKINKSNTKSGSTEIIIDFDGNLVTYQLKDLVNIKHGYIISIHKSQGSEFELVIMIVCKSYKRMLYRKLVYTGITRAKRRLILIGDANAFLYAVKNNLESKRKTSLLERLLNSLNN